MVRLLVYLLAGLVLASCSKEPLFTTLPATYQQATSPEQPAPAVVLPKKNNGVINVQVGAGNVATTTDNTQAGKKADDGANGGHAEQRSSAAPWWVFVGLVLLGCAGGVWVYRKFWPG